MATVTTDQVKAYEDGWYEWGNGGNAELANSYYLEDCGVDEAFKPALESAWRAGWWDAGHRSSTLSKWHSLECFKDDHTNC